MGQGLIIKMFEFRIYKIGSKVNSRVPQFQTDMPIITWLIYPGLCQKKCKKVKKIYQEKIKFFF